MRLVQAGLRKVTYALVVVHMLSCTEPSPFPCQASLLVGPCVLETPTQPRYVQRTCSPLLGVFASSARDMPEAAASRVCLSEHAEHIDKLTAQYGTSASLR